MGFFREYTTTPLSILDLVRVTEETDARGALDNARDLAVHAESWGYRRIWVAEHHNMPGIASAATSVVLAHIGAGTRTIRIGAGGIMLPNHAPYVIAEQFGTLARLFPGRVDLGLGRAPGTDQLTLRALRRSGEAADNFPQDVLEVQAFLAPAGPSQRIQAVPAAGTEVPLWILGSSHFGAMLAAELGLMPSLRISRRTNSFRRCRSIAAASSPPNSLMGPTPWSASTSSRPTVTPRHGAWPQRSKCPLRTSFAARAA
jgi:luciferase family oxidoreductase group 1